MPIYIDADTGEQVSEADLNDYEPAGDPSWLQTFGYGLGSIPFKIAKAGGGLGDMFEENTGVDIPFWDPQNTIDSANMFLDRGRDRYDMTGATGWKGTVGETIGDIAPMIAAMSAGAPLAMAVGGAQTLGNKYEQYRDAGAEPGRAAVGSGVVSFIDTGLNLLPMGVALKSGTPLVQRTINTGLSNILTSPFSTTNQLIGDAWTAGTIPEDIAGRYAENLRGDVVSSLIMGPAGHAIDTIQSRPGRIQNEHLAALARAENMLAADTKAQWVQDITEKRKAEADLVNAETQLRQFRDVMDGLTPEQRAMIDNGDNLSYLFKPDSAFEIAKTPEEQAARDAAIAEREAFLKTVQLDPEAERVAQERAVLDAYNAEVAKKAVDNLQGLYRAGEDVTLPDAVKAKQKKGIFIPGDNIRTPEQQKADPGDNIKTLEEQAADVAMLRDTIDANETMSRRYPLQSLESIFPEQRKGIYQFEPDIQQVTNPLLDFSGYRSYNLDNSILGSKPDSAYKLATQDMPAEQPNAVNPQFDPAQARANIADIGYRAATEGMQKPTPDLQAIKEQLDPAVADLYRAVSDPAEQAKILPPQEPKAPVEDAQAIAQQVAQEAGDVAPKERNPESGALNIGGIVDTIGNFWDSRKSDVTPEERAKAKAVPRNPLDEGDSYWLGDILHKNIPGLSKVRAGYRRAIVYPQTVAQKFSEFRPIFDRAMSYFKQRDQTTYKLAEGVREYFDLEDPTRVNNALIAIRMLSKDAKAGGSKETILQQLTPGERKIVNDVYKTMDESLNVLRDALINSFDEDFRPEDNRIAADGRAYIDQTRVEKLRAAHNTRVEKFISDLRNENYVPFSRFGDEYVLGKNDKGEVIHYSFHENKKSIEKAKIDLIRSGVKDISTGRVVKPTEEAYDGMPADLLARLREVDGEIETKFGSKLPPLGFTKHLESAKLTEGFSKDLQRSVAEYIASLGSYTSRLALKKDFKAGMADISNRSQIYGYAKRYTDYILDSGKEGAAVREALAHFYLGGNVKSALVNLTQTATLTYPKLSKYSNAPMKDTLHAMGQAAKYFSNKESFAKAHPELATALQRALEDGELTSGASRELYRKAQGKSGKTTLRDASMALFSGAERTNRVIAFIAGHNAAVKNGMKGDAASHFAEKFVDETQFIYSKANRPEVFRGAMAPLGTFRNFTGSYIRALRNELTHDRKVFTGAGWRMLGTMATLGGGAAIPGVKELVGLVTSLGEDPKLKVREAIGDNTLADVLMYGVPSLAGLNLSGSVGIGELAPDLEVSPEDAFARYTLGVLYDPKQRIERAYKNAEKGNLYRAGEALLPEAARNLAVAGRWAYEGAAINPQGREMFKPTPYDIGKKAMGLTPTEYARAIERDNSMYALDKEATTVNGNINARMAEAIVNKGDVNSIIQEVLDHNRNSPPHLRINIDRGAVNRKVYDLKHPKEAQIRDLPVKARPEGIRRQQVYGR